MRKLLHGFLLAIIVIALVKVLMMSTAEEESHSQEALRSEAEQIPATDFDLRGATFGYVSQKVAALPHEISYCGYGNGRVTNCIEAHWGKPWLVVGTFMTSSGDASASDSDELVNLRVNSIDAFKISFCGEQPASVKASGAACGMAVTIDDNVLTYQNPSIR